MESYTLGLGSAWTSRKDLQRTLGRAVGQIQGHTAPNQRFPPLDVASYWQALGQ